MTDGVLQSGRRRILHTALRAGDLLVMATSFLVALVASGLSSDPKVDLAEFLGMRFSLANIAMAVGFTLTWYLVFEALGLYRSGRLQSFLNESSRILRAVALGTVLLAASGPLFGMAAITRTFILAFFLLALLGTVVTRRLLRLLLGEARRHGRNLRHLVIVGSGPRGRDLGATIRRRTDLGYLLLGYVDDIEPPTHPMHDGPEKWLGRLDELEEVLQRFRVDEVLVALPVKSYYEVFARVIGVAEDLGIIVRMPADFFRLEVARAEVDYLDALPVMTLQTPRPSAGGLLLKRAFDLTMGSLALLLLSPLLLAIALVIRLDSRGPAVFRQDRIGLNRRVFSMLKFRTMVQDAEELQAGLEERNEVEGAAFKLQDDPRITRVGAFLRKFSLDELPQLWNVLVGEMSIVGPRPLPLRDVELFNRRWQNRRFSVKPGLTCLWQANGRHDIAFDEWMELDLQYIDQWSFGLDLEIVLKTVPSVLRGTGAS